MASESRIRSDDSESGAADILLFPFRFIWGFIVFMVFAWTTSRSGRAFVFAMPAMFFAVIYIAFVWAAEFKGETKAFALSVFHQRKTADDTDVRFNPEAALLFARKMEEVQPYKNDVKFVLAESLERAGKIDQAFDIMTWLTQNAELDIDSGPFIASQAHLWLAKFYSNQENDSTNNEDSDRERRKQIELAYSAFPRNVSAVLAMATMFRKDALDLEESSEKLIKDGKQPEADWEKEKNALNREASKYFKEAVDMDVQTAGQLYASTYLVEILKEQGRDDEALREGRQFINTYETTAIQNPDLLPLWVSIARTCILIEDYDQAEKFIVRGYQLATNNQVRNVLLRLRAQVFVEKAKKLKDMNDRAQFEGRLFSLCGAIESNVTSQFAYEELLYFIDGFGQQDQQEQWLRLATVGSSEVSDQQGGASTPGIVHLVLGLREIINADKKSGLGEWEIASQQFSLAPIAVNYLVTAFDQHRSLNRAKRLHLINCVIERFPQAPFAYKTRGEFLLEYNEFQKALEDLEFYNSRIPGDLDVLKDLVRCLNETGGEEQIKEFEDQIAQIEAERERKKKGEDILTSFYSEIER